MSKISGGRRVDRRAALTSCFSLRSEGRRATIRAQRPEPAGGVVLRYALPSHYYLPGRDSSPIIR